MKKKFPTKLKPRGFRELVYKLETYLLSDEFCTVGSYYHLDTMQAAKHLLALAHRSPWDYKALTQQELFDVFERHFTELTSKLSSEAFNVSVADLFFDALDYLAGDRYLIKWRQDKNSEPVYVLHYQHSAFGTPADVEQHFGDCNSDSVQAQLMKVWLELNSSPAEQTPVHIRLAEEQRREKTVNPAFEKECERLRELHGPCMGLL